MKKLKRIIDALFKAFEECYEEPQEEPYPYHSNPSKKEDNYNCPICTFSGTLDDVKEHINDNH